MKNDFTYYTELITKYFAGEASSEEIKMLSVWLKSDIENQKVFNEYQKTWSLIENEKINNNIDIEEEWEKIKPVFNTFKEQETPVVSIHSERKIIRNFFYKTLRIAAVFIVLAAISFIVYHYIRTPEKEQFVAQSETTEKILSDGTSVTLNKGSHLEYPKHFKSNKRTVTLKGEAYFNVTHDETKPFIIAAGDIMVEVLGTSFFVSIDTINQKVDVVLTYGKVAVYKKDKPSDITILNPGEKAEFLKTTDKIVKSENDDINYMAFKTKKLVFSNTELNEIAITLGKVYHSDIIIKNINIKNCRVTATFDNQSLDAVLNVLKATLDINVNKSRKTIEITGTGCK